MNIITCNFVDEHAVQLQLLVAKGDEDGFIRHGKHSIQHSYLLTASVSHVEMLENLKILSIFLMFFYIYIFNLLYSLNIIYAPETKLPA